MLCLFLLTFPNLGKAKDIPLHRSDFKILDEKSINAVREMVQYYKSRSSESPAVCNGRLTLTSGTAITTSDVTAASTVYFTPFNGNQISLYSGTVWQLVSFTERSVSVPATTTTPFDIYAYNNSGTVTLETVNWTNDTTRATALTTQDGVYVKTGATTRRYLGTARTTSSSGQTEDSAAKRYLWNSCNRVPRFLLASSTTDTWDYTTLSWRAANSTTTTGVTRVEFVIGQLMEPVHLRVYVPSVFNSDTNGSNVVIGIGIDSSTANSALLVGGWAGLGTVAKPNMQAFYRGFPAVGTHYAQWLEAGFGVGTSSWYTSLQSGGTQRQGGLFGDLWQ